MNIFRKWLEHTNETLLDLIFGCLAYSLVFELIGLILVPNKGSYSLGLLLGTAVAIGCAVSMAAGIRHVLTMDRFGASRTSVIYSLLRTIVMLAAAWLGLKYPQISFPGVVIGMIGLKVSAHLHAYTNVYITRPLCRRKRQDQKKEI
ncbi:MAG: hypothetical protein IKX76_07115 [Eubacterium sp.]|nr:hypothetical protein [Eubacterium sp.]